LTSFVAGLQPRFFKGRLVGNLGYRVDKLETVDRNDNVRDPATNILIVNYVNGLDVDFTGETRTYGVVGHVTRNLSLLGNYATNLGLPNPRNSIIPGRKAPARTGQGKDVGIALSLLDGRVYARAVYYETAGQNLTGARGIFALNTTNTMVLEALVAANAITPAQAAGRSLGPSDVMTYDLTSEGYEFQVTANLTANWRLIANFSITEASEQNVGLEVKPWIAENFAFWRTFNQSIVTSRALTIAQELINITNTLDEQFETEGDIVFGNRKHKANLFTRYGFSSGPLRGLSAGAGYRHQSKIVIGRSATGNVYGNSVSRFDAMLGYQVRGLPKDLKLGLQLNVTNVLDEQAPLILRYQGANVRRYALSAGREWRLAANLDF
jgi:outer membrane receptor for ferric coprogen and ferric-rhodotorulic acid